MEYRPGGIDEAVKRLKDATDAEVTITHYNSNSTSQQWSFGNSALARRAARLFSLGSKNVTPLPRHNPPSQPSIPMTATSPATDPIPAAQQSLHLLSCVHKTRELKSLLQESIDEIKNDQSLFLFLKEQLRRNRNRLRCLIFLRGIQGIYFLKASHHHTQRLRTPR